MFKNFKPKLKLTDIDDLTKQLNFQSTEGRLWLGDQRVILSQITELAALRRELIQSIGVERTKGLFLRNGYQSGLRDAELARRMRPELGEMDIFLAGPQLHSLKGMVKNVPIKIDIDIKSGQFYGELEWVDSFEVEIIQTEMGRLNEPVCWSLLGYASAFTSSFMQKEIVFKEVSCVGCGDIVCKIVGKPAQEWTDGYSLAKYFQEEPVTEALHRLQNQVNTLRDDPVTQQAHYYGIGESKAYQDACQKIDKAAQSKVSVLLLGETGVGKEVIARSLHLRSQRSNEAFIAVNCAAIPSELVEAELFGVDKGAFTGADSTRIGRFERAHNGTIFLDEVVELSPRAQATLLRVIQESEFERVGGTRLHKVDVRIIAAANESLFEATRNGRFREDLYYRLNVFPVSIPPLRERTDDLHLLVNHFLSIFHKLYAKKTLGLSDKSWMYLKTYAWPGNIRELENVIERGVILTENNSTISLQSIFSSSEQDELSKAGLVYADGRFIDNADKDLESDGWLSQVMSTKTSLVDVERQLIKRAMSEAQGNVSKAARSLGISRPALAYRIKKIDDKIDDKVDDNE